MDIQQLKYFLSVSRNKSYTKAAAEMYISRQAITQSVRHLEQELQISLFYRDKSSLRLSSFGETFQREAEKIVSDFKRFETSMLAYAAHAPATLRISIGAGILMHLTEDLFASFHEAHPNILLQMKEMDNQEMTAQIREGSADIALIGTSGKFLSDYETTLIRRNTLCICVHHDNPLSEKDYLTFADLEGQPMVGHGEGYDLHRFYVEKCLEHGFAPTFSVISSDPYIAIKLVQQNRSLCFGISSENEIKKTEGSSAKMIPLKTDGSEDWGIYAITRKGQKRTMAQQLLIEWL